MNERRKGRIALAAALALCCSLLYGCGLFGKDKEDNTVYDIASAEEFQAMEESKNYRLTADIDLNDTEWTTRKIKSLDGDGHTVKNAFMNRESVYYNTGFFREIKELKNVTFENLQVLVTVKDTKTSEKSVVGYSTTGIIAGTVGNAENVTVKNCKAEISLDWSNGNAYTTKFNYVGVLAGSNSENKITLKNCRTENCSVKVTNAYGNNSVQIGGLIGADGGGYADMENCSAEKISLNVQTAFGVSAGGFIGAYGIIPKGTTNGDGKIKSSVASACEITIRVGSEEEFARVGGFMGLSMAPGASAENCAAVKNTLGVTSGYGYNAGGFVGKTAATLRDCLSDGNTLTCYMDTDKVTANAGGFCGSSTGSVLRCVAQNNTVGGTYIPQSEAHAAGFTAYGTTVMYCGACNNTVTGAGADAFANEATAISGCRLAEGAGTTSPNAQSVESVSAETWGNMIETLKLTKEYWQNADDKLTLKIVAA